MRFQESYSKLQNDYVSLQETHSTVRSDYVELQEMYSTLRSEYSNLQDWYSTLEMEKLSLQNEYDEVKRLEKRVVLEENKTLNLAAGENATLSYDILFAGYIEVNFTASSDIYFWVGSPLTQEIYYARYPPFPNTAMNGTAIIPVCAEVFLHINNPSEFTNSTVTLTITYIY